jgi:hypothetical protein
VDEIELIPGMGELVSRVQHGHKHWTYRTPTGYTSPFYSPTREMALTRLAQATAPDEPET